MMFAPIETAYSVLELPTLGEPAVSPDGRQLAFIKQTRNRRQLFTMPITGGLPAQITGLNFNAAHPVWSPDSKRIAYSGNGGIWIVDVETGNWRCITQNTAGDDWPLWSPDGARILFASRRRGWSQWFVIPVEGGETVCITPGTRDFARARPSPDGNLIACQCRNRENAERNELWLFPFDGSGEGRCITPDGDLWEISPEWSSDSRALFAISESPQNGWAHIVRIPIDNALAGRTIVSAGNFEHQLFALSHGSENIAFTRIEDGITELYVGRLHSEKPYCTGIRRVNITPGNVNSLVFSCNARTLYVVRQAPTEIPQLVSMNLDNGECRPISQTRIPGVSGTSLITPKRISFKNREGSPIAGWLWAPHTAESGKTPLLVNAHGGPTAYSRFDFSMEKQILVSHGYGILEIDYRGSSGYGRVHRQGHNGRWGEADANDLIDGANWACGTEKWINKARIAIMGGSYGGYLVYCAIIAAPELFRCAVANCGDSELYLSYQHGDRPGRLDLLRAMGDPERSRDLYRQASPLYRVEDIQAPLLIQHGRDDINVVPLMTELMAAALRAQGKQCDVKFYEGEGHGLSKPENRLDAMQRTLDFFELHLKKDGSRI